MKNITIDEFYHDQLNLIGEFYKDCVKNNNKDPEGWPNEMWLGDFEEQFLIFKEDYEAEKD